MKHIQSSESSARDGRAHPLVQLSDRPVDERPGAGRAGSLIEMRISIDFHGHHGHVMMI